MGIYRDRIFPRLLDVAIDTRHTRPIRRRVCAALHGVVLEVGFGTGHNLPYLPPAVTRLLAVDPMARGRALAAGRLARAEVPVDFVGLDGQQLPLVDASVDTALCTWSLCSIDDPVAAVREVRRVLRPGGTFHFVEHGRAPDDRVGRWQHRGNVVQRQVAAGCRLDRAIPDLITAGGLAIDRLDTYYAPGHPRLLGWTFEGWASAP